MIELTSRPKPPIRRPGGRFLAPRAGGGLLHFAAKCRFVNRTTASIGWSMSWILKERKCPNPGEKQFHIFGIPPDSGAEGPTHPENAKIRRVLLLFSDFDHLESTT
jgi:hypothetical protein